MGFELRLALDSDVSEIRRLVNSAYKELSDLGLNYTATYQDEKITLERMNQGRCFLISLEKRMIATILLSQKNLFTGSNTSYVGQFAVSPDFKKQGLGNLLMELTEQLSQEEGFQGIQLDTAQPAVHLVRWYINRGYKIVGEEQWEGKTYKSWIFEKSFIQNPRPDLETLRA